MLNGDVFLRPDEAIEADDELDARVGDVTRFRIVIHTEVLRGRREAIAVRVLVERGQSTTGRFASRSSCSVLALGEEVEEFRRRAHARAAR